MDAATEQNLITLSRPLVANPTAWQDLDEPTKGAFRQLKGSPSFSDKQRFYLNLWWLPVTQEQVDEMNAAQSNVHISPREDVSGSLFIGADLLTDADSGDRLSGILGLLEVLPLTCKPDAQWPVPEEPE